MLVLDIDGTLTTSKKEISPETLDAIMKIQQLGYHVVLASGRPTAGIIKMEWNKYYEDQKVKPYAFEKRKDLYEVSLPEETKEIGVYAFSLHNYNDMLEKQVPLFRQKKEVSPLHTV